MHTVPRFPPIRAILALACVLALTGCGIQVGRTLINGYYVSRDSNAGILMAQLIEAPRGHLSGALVATTVQQSSSGLAVKRVTVQGSIDGDNVILKTPGLFGAFRTVYIGTLKGDRLTLSRQGRSSFTLYLSSGSGYQKRIAALKVLQANINAMRNTNRLIRSTLAYVKRLNAAIPRYLAWGRTRIANQAAVNAWWQHKAKYYDACLAKIRPLAAEGVPEWRWSHCAMTVRDDAWNREQEVKLLLHEQQVDRVNARAIERMIREAPIKVRATARAIYSVCPYSQKPKVCDAEWQHWNASAASLSLLIPEKRLAAFHALRPQVHQALQNDATVTTEANNRLQTVAAKVIAIYDEPYRYRKT